jgi:hypothetical protein
MWNFCVTSLAVLGHARSSKMRAEKSPFSIVVAAISSSTTSSGATPHVTRAIFIIRASEM